MAMTKSAWDPSPKMLRNFGLIGLVAFGAFAGLTGSAMFPMHWVPSGAVKPVTIALAVLAAYCGVFALAAPTLVKPVYLAMTVIGYPIGAALSYVMVSMMFLLVVTPIALFFKAIGRDPLCRKFDPSAATYWIERRPPETVKRYFRQF